MIITERIKKQMVFFDGGMGSLLQARGLKPGEYPEMWNILHPDVIYDIHRQYLEAGANILKTNTFGANSLKFTGKDGMPALSDVVRAAEDAARRAIEECGRDDTYVALDLGPCGKLLEPLGDMPFESAVELFAEVVEAGKDRADLILIETMNDSYETKAAVLAAKEHSQLPIFVTNVYDEDKKLLTGADPLVMIAMLEGLGADAIGMNCSLGPEQMEGFIPDFLNNASVPIIVNPNAGLPRSDENGNTVYDVDADTFSDIMARIAKKGVMILGGCCGTTPEFIRKTVEKTKDIPFRLNPPKDISIISSGSKTVLFGRAPVLIGERINPTGKKRFQQALREHDIDHVLEEGIRQQEAGAHVLDVNVGLPEIDEDALMSEVVFELQSVSDLPLQIDTTDSEVMEHALRIYNGKPMINSVNGKREIMEAVFPLAAKYGGLVVGLTIDEDGIPKSARGRVDIAAKIYETAEKYGIEKKNIIIDPLAMAVSADDKSGAVTIEAVRCITNELGGMTSLGVSNISFGLPARHLINGTFFTMAMQAGLKAAIMNPFSYEMMSAYRSFLALSGQDENCLGYINYVNQLPEDKKTAGVKKTSSGTGAAGTPVGADVAFGETAGPFAPLMSAIEKGLKEKAGAITGELIEDNDPLDLVNGAIVPALDVVGKGFEEKKLFLPQLLMAADAATAAFDVIKEKITAEDSGDGADRTKVVVATVKGDIHDIGKNIVKVLLENYGFDVIDLGKDVPPETVLEAVLKDNVPICGLSALMTTTVPAMEETIKLLHEKAPFCKTVVGGAVLTQEYADMINADKYCKDAMETVRYCGTVAGRK